MKVLAVIPVYNEAETIGGLVEALATEGFAVLVDDGGSTDGSQKIAAAAGAQVLQRPAGLGPLAQIINNKDLLSKYAGKGFRYIVTLDAGGNHSPKDATRMVELVAQAGAEVVLATRPIWFEWRGFRTLLSRAAAWLLGADDATCGFRCYPLWTWLKMPEIHNRTGFTFHFVVLGLLLRDHELVYANLWIPYITSGRTSLNWRAIRYAIQAMVQLKLGRVPTC